jgi:hypothetical protein
MVRAGRRSKTGIRPNSPFWLRVEGYAADEKTIWQHEWFEILESDDEDEDRREIESDNTDVPVFSPHP